MVVPGEEDAAAHDVALVAARPERGPDSAADEHLAVVGVIRYRALVPA
jgi:hypothetical protein